MTKVVRLDMFRSFSTPNFFDTAPPSSLRIANSKFSDSANFLLVSSGSVLMPKTTAPESVKVWIPA